MCISQIQNKFMILHVTYGNIRQDCKIILNYSLNCNLRMKVQIGSGV